MPRYYYLYPSHDGPFPNPFSGPDPLERLAPEAILAYREALRTIPKAEASSREEASDDVLRFFTLDAGAVAFTVLFNRMLEQRPPTESHLEHGLSEIAARTVEFCFYLWSEAGWGRMHYGAKRHLEALILEWCDDAKDSWRAQVLNPNSDIIMPIPEVPRQFLPQRPGTYLQQELWTVPPRAKRPDNGIAETLYSPPIHPDVPHDQMTAWIAEALKVQPTTARLEWQEWEMPAIGSGSPSKLPERASWLADCLALRGWGEADPYAHGGPDRKTIKKILAGESVSNHVLKKLADALKISPLEVPRG